MGHPGNELTDQMARTAADQKENVQENGIRPRGKPSIAPVYGKTYEISSDVTLFVVMINLFACMTLWL